MSHLHPGAVLRLRNPLFAPGDSGRKTDKALQSSADAVILDLEDSVAPGGKGAARDAVSTLLKSSPARPGLLVRVNGRDTDWYLHDLAAVAAGQPDAIMLPKCTSPADLSVLDGQLAALETAFGLAAGAIGVLLLVTETVLSLRSMDYAGVSSRLRGLVFGAEDLAADLGIDPRGADGRYAAPVVVARAAVILAAAQAGVPALDTPWPDPRDPAGLRAEAVAAAADGFAGKLCIHPDQLGPVADAFTPAPGRVAWAEAVRDLFGRNPGAGVLSLDGRMVDRPHLRLAERILAAGS